MMICGPSQPLATRHASAGHTCNAFFFAQRQQQRTTSFGQRSAGLCTRPQLPPMTPSAAQRRCAQQLCSAVSTQQATATEVMQDLQASKAAGAIIQYALEFARASETYEVNSWMLLLGILKHEQCTAAKTLRAMGLDDLYGAWHEVLWALNVCDALEAKPFVPEISFADRAYRVLVGAGRFAEWGGRKKVQSEDLLMALAAGAVLDGLFPDIKPTFTRVRRAVEQQAGGVYVLPDDGEDSQPGLPADEDNFL